MLVNNLTHVAARRHTATLFSTARPISCYSLGLSFACTTRTFLYIVHCVGRSVFAGMRIDSGGSLSSTKLSGSRMTETRESRLRPLRTHQPRRSAPAQLVAVQS